MRHTSEHPGKCNAARSAVRAVLVAVCFCVLAGCTPWPHSGTGGLAERYAADQPAIADLRRQFEDLVRRHAYDYAPAAMTEARLLIIRAMREHEAGLAGDVAQTRAKAASVLDSIEQDPRLKDHAISARRSR